MMHAQKSGLNENMVLCHFCSHVSEQTEKQKGFSLRCPRCHAKVHLRKIDSVRRTWLFIFLGFAFFIPSHIFPIMSITELGVGTNNKTIMGGVIQLLDADLWVLAGIVFIASVVVPLVKLVGLSFLLLCIKNQWLSYRFRMTQMYRMIVFIGRWSMVDIFIAALFVSLIQLGTLMNIETGIAATAFAAMCVITMVAAELFDPRLLWDHEEN